MSYRDTFEEWLASGHLDAEEKNELLAIRDDDKEIESRFYGLMSFGTAGLRGVMGVGTARMNVHVIRHATQAFVSAILDEGEQFASKGIAVCHDCRNNSRAFAETVAAVAAANGVPVRIFEDMRPTPELSFAIRYYGCAGGVNITASHNPKEYNGYKVYWSDGAQLPPAKAEIIAEQMASSDIFTSPRLCDYKTAVDTGLITVMGKETDEAFIERVMTNLFDADVIKTVADSFRIVFTPFHGVGREMVPEVLRRAGFSCVSCVPEQMVPDGNFPTVASPNPENPEGFALAEKQAVMEKAQLIIGTDPDADRIAIMAPDRDGKFGIISGNTTGVLMLDYLIGAMRRGNKLPPAPVALKTIVTTEMARVCAEQNGVRSYDTFTGFKFMAERKNELEAKGEGKVIFSYEESIGYMIGDYVRDKDAVTAALVLAEMAAWYHSKDMTLFEAIDELYERYGFYSEKTINLIMPGLDGAKKMADLMTGLRENRPSSIEGAAVTSIVDYECGKVYHADGRTEDYELRGSNVLKFCLADGTNILIRPSGTEPKIKVYILAKGRDKKDAAEKVSIYEKWAVSLGE